MLGSAARTFFRSTTSQALRRGPFAAPLTVPQAAFSSSAPKGTPEKHLRAAVRRGDVEKVKELLKTPGIDVDQA